MSDGVAGSTRTERLALPALAVLLVLALAVAARWERPAPYGDRLTVHASAAATLWGSPQPVLRRTARSVEAYDPASGARWWTYSRHSRRPLAVRTAPGHAFILWNDGMITDTGPPGTVRWHRAIPGAAAWLAHRAARRGADVLRPLDGGWRTLAVVTPRRIAAYRSADGDLRWVLPARPGCSFAPRLAVRRGAVLMVAQPCSDGRRAAGTDPAWTAELVAVDGRGRITPERGPLGDTPRGPV
ncbi:hypothetical protein [Streptomyces sp. 8N706]|uniref:hypothetical protein n=1 Tax=Streptomyces sp. 8N706 TaxID=3457416 RepID=UPI003FD2F496